MEPLPKNWVSAIRKVFLCLVRYLMILNIQEYVSLKERDTNLALLVSAEVEQDKWDTKF